MENYNRHSSTSTDHEKLLHDVANPSDVPRLVQISPEAGFLGKWEKYNQILYTLFGN